MRARSVSAVVAALVVGVVGGGAAAFVARPGTHGSRVPHPLSASGPAYPQVVTPKPPKVVADLDSPALTTPTAYTVIKVGNSLATWKVVKPKGWQAWCIGVHGAETAIPDSGVDDCASSGVYFRPPGEPSVGGYSMRIQLVASHLTPALMEANKRSAIVDSPTYKEVQVLDDTTPSSLYLSLLTPKYGTTDGYLFRYNFFRWFATEKDADDATLEMSISGRRIDDAGLRGLFDAFAARVSGSEPVG